jgi:hypothetical protein
MEPGLRRSCTASTAEANGNLYGYRGESFSTSGTTFGPCSICIRPKRKRGGLAVAAHFPYPTGKIAADVALGKIDAVEIWPTPLDFGAQAGHFNYVRYLDWYHYLNCGYRLPAVGGTDKMGSDVAVGVNRAYAYIGNEEFTFANWAKAVRKGNTFVTSGPLLQFQADGRTPGQEITFNAGGGTIEVQATAKSFMPFHQLRS